MEDLLTSRATLIFLVANIALSVMAFSNDGLMRWGILNTRAVLQGKDYHRLLTSGFLHADPAHLFVNMLTLFFFGPPVEIVLGEMTGMGSIAFLCVYLGALLGGNSFALWRHRNDPNYMALGASGAVSGIIFTFCLFAPFQSLYLFFVLRMPAIVFALLYVAYSIYGMRAARDNIGHDAHLGGAFIGIAIAVLLHPELLGIFIGQITQALGA